MPQVFFFKATSICLKESATHEVIHMPCKTAVSMTTRNQTQISYREPSDIFIRGPLIDFQKQTNKNTGTKISPLKCPRMFRIRVNCEKLDNAKSLDMTVTTYQTKPETFAQPLFILMIKTSIFYLFLIQQAHRQASVSRDTYIMMYR